MPSLEVLRWSPHSAPPLSVFLCVSVPHFSSDSADTEAPPPSSPRRRSLILPLISLPSSPCCSLACLHASLPPPLPLSPPPLHTDQLSRVHQDETAALDRFCLWQADLPASGRNTSCRRSLHALQVWLWRFVSWRLPAYAVVSWDPCD